MSPATFAALCLLLALGAVRRGVVVDAEFYEVVS